MLAPLATRCFGQLVHLLAHRRPQALGPFVEDILMCGDSNTADGDRVHLVLNEDVFDEALVVQAQLEPIWHTGSATPQTGFIAAETPRNAPFRH